MPKWWGAAALCALAVLGLTTPAGAAKKPKPTEWGNSVIDVDNSGTISAGDLPLKDFPDGLDVTKPSPGWTPRAHPVGLILDGAVVLHGDYVTFTVTGDMHLAGSVTTKKESGLRLTTRGNDARIDIAKKFKVNFTGDFDIEAVNAANQAVGTLTIGANAQLQVGGDFMFMRLVARDIVVESGVKAHAKGGYSEFWLRGDSVTLAPNVSLTGASRGGVGVMTTTDLTLNNATLKAGYIYLFVDRGTQPHPPARTLRIVNSTITQTYKNGTFRAQVPVGPDNQYAPEAIVFDKTVLNTKTDDVQIYPDPVCKNGTKHVRPKNENDVCTPEWEGS